MMDFDGTSLYTFAMWYEISANPKIEKGFVFKPHLKDAFVKSFNDQIFNQHSDEPAILKIKYWNPPDLIFQPLLVEEKVKNIEVKECEMV